MAGATIEPIRIRGLAEFRRNLKMIERGLPKLIRGAGNEAAQIVVDWARPRIPERSGRARRSVRTASTQTSARVSGGGARAAYYPWLDFGGRVGRRKHTVRPFIHSGRFIYAGYAANVDRVKDVYADALVRLVETSGLEVD